MVLFNLKEVHISNLEEGTVLDKCPGGPPPLVHHLIRALDSTAIIIFENTACVFAVYRGVFFAPCIHERRRDFFFFRI